MEKTVHEFIASLHSTGRASRNTEISYQRDLEKLVRYLRERKIADMEEVTGLELQGYLNEMEREHFASSSISRSAASIRALFHFLYKEGKIKRDPSEELRTPRVEKKMPEILSVEEVDRLLRQPDRNTPKGMRDAAMLELMYATGMRVSELLHLRVEDVELRLGYVVCHENGKERIFPIGEVSRNALLQYLERSRGRFVSPEEEALFTNCSGRAMSRQGFWKMIKGYAEEAGIQGDITPHTLRHSFAAHMLQNGADVRSVQEMLGHSDISSTQVYLAGNMNKMREVYMRAHPRR